jgi:hypothetical protein
MQDVVGDCQYSLLSISTLLLWHLHRLLLKVSSSARLFPQYNVLIRLFLPAFIDTHFLYHIALNMRPFSFYLRASAVHYSLFNSKSAHRDRLRQDAIYGRVP